jgi:hypothetical protein
MVMEGTDKEQEQWIEKYRAAVEAVSQTKQPYSPGLGSVIDGVRSHFQGVFRSARDRLRRSALTLEPGKNEMPAVLKQPPLGEGQTKEGTSAEQLTSTDSESRKAS